jgi:hypothetical protein
VEALADRRLHSRVLQSPLARGVRRAGVMLHYDDSSRDDWAVEWFLDPRCTNGYTWLVLDDGRVIELADPAIRTPHAGACRTPNANSVYWGIAAATNGRVVVTRLQLDSIVKLCAALMQSLEWPADAHAAARAAPPCIVGHDAEAIWTPKTTRAAGMADERGRTLWGKLGRKVDPTGVRADGVPVLDVAVVRARVSALLGGQQRPRSASCAA